jgi:hypothetical protein
MFAVIERPVHFVFSETVTNAHVTNFDTAAQAFIHGSVVIKAQGLKPGPNPSPH